MEKSKLVLKKQIIASLSGKGINGVEQNFVTTPFTSVISGGVECPSEVCDTNVCTIQTK